MANKIWAYGIAPVKTIGGGTPEMDRFPLKSNFTVTAAKYLQTAIFKYAPVTLHWNTTYKAAYVMPYTATTAPAKTWGVAAEYVPAGTSTKDIALYLCSKHEFRVWCTNATTLDVSKRIGSCMPLYSTSPYSIELGNTTNGISACAANLAQASVTTAKTLRIIGADPMMNDRGGRAIGETVVVTQVIEGGEGRVKLGDSEWIAKGPDAEPGTRMRVASHNGSVLMVEYLH